MRATHINDGPLGTVGTIVAFSLQNTEAVEIRRLVSHTPGPSMAVVLLVAAGPLLDGPPGIPGSHVLPHGAT